MELAEKLENFSHGVHGAAEPQPNLVLVLVVVLPMNTCGKFLTVSVL